MFLLKSLFFGLVFYIMSDLKGDFAFDVMHNRIVFDNLDKLRQIYFRARVNSRNPGKRKISKNKHCMKR